MYYIYLTTLYLKPDVNLWWTYRLNVSEFIIPCHAYVFLFSGINYSFWVDSFSSQIKCIIFAVIFARDPKMYDQIRMYITNIHPHHLCWR